jgi:integrase/recombinase XerD
MSTLRKHANEYINLRRKLGYKLYKSEIFLNSYITFLENENISFITVKSAINWAKKTKDSSSYYWHSRLSVIRKFSYYVNAIDKRNEIPPLRLLSCRYQRSKPYIYNDNEILKLLNASLLLKSDQGIRSQIYYAIFGLLAVTGLRISELTSLVINDVDFIQGHLIVRKTKKRNARIIPVHKSTLQILSRYLCFRYKIKAQNKSFNFFISEEGTNITNFTVRSTFIKLSRKIGFRKSTDSFGPRLHDFRHTFAVNTIIQWYKENADVDAKIPILSTYLGHVKPSDTYWYLSFVPELVALTGKRFEKYLGGSE